MKPYINQVMAFINQWINDSTDRWGISPTTARWLFWGPLIVTPLVLVTRVYEDIYRFLLTEDGPVEWSGFACFLGASILSVLIARQRFQADHLWQMLLFGGVAVAMFFAAGEEISWGQRIFNWETPENIEDINEQGETSVHNLNGVLDVTNVVMFTIGLYGSGAYLVNKRLQVERYWDQADYLFITPFFLMSFFLVIFVYKLLRFTVLNQSNATLTRAGEWSEFVVALGIFIYVLLIYRHLTTQQARTGVLQADQA